MHHHPSITGSTGIDTTRQIGEHHPAILGATGMDADFQTYKALRPQAYEEPPPHAAKESLVSRGRPRCLERRPADPLLEDPVRFDLPDLRDNGPLRMITNAVVLARENISVWCHRKSYSEKNWRANQRDAALGLDFLMRDDGFFAVWCLLCGADVSRTRWQILEQFDEGRLDVLMKTEEYQQYAVRYPN